MSNKKSSTILIVDDNPLNLKMLRVILKNEEYSCLEASDGVQAIQIAKNEKPDLILLDIMMPRMDGYQVCQTLKREEETANIPVIFLTSKTDAEGIVHGFEVGASDYVTRPFNRIELLARIKTHLSLKQSQERILELERRNSILAMITTTNHEINQPLTVLNGNLFLLKDSLNIAKLTKEQQSYFQRIDHAIEKIRDILIKYRRAESMRLESYSGKEKMVVFDDK